MGSYEEMVVDRIVDAAWLDFRVRLADHVAAMEVGDVLTLGLRDGDDDWTVEVLITGASAACDVLWEWADETDRRLARHGRSFRVPGGATDAYVMHLSDVLIDAGAPHPSFVDVLSGDLVIVDPPKPLVATAAAPEMPESVTPASHDDLVAWVDRVITQRLGREPKKLDSGSIGLARDDDRLQVRVSRSRPIIEVWATVARSVDVRKARKMLPRLNASFHFFSFSLAGDSLVVSTTVNAKPFCPAHVDRAIDSTFTYLADEAGKVRAKLVRKQPKDAATDNAINSDLLLVYGAAGDRKAMIQMARGLTGDSRTSLGQWAKAAVKAGRLAREKAAGAKHGPVQNALIDQVIAWTSVADAMSDALEEILIEEESA
ncbi:T3SS (YopN, CesT) and YbjN peptide-binding chaperone 1 [Aeromicrobium stalagmiti]|uniref:T3SS (YopN, CesT) and YbjN peptide-binding chaperone 1 n=1 Tax=Aeromicrobium stalagmiti TaxID=2738988 RepID=UPI001569A37A|nr:hypothetical protein [Aeromicrobium stalagmiti]NRQ50418.1 hypothetical protein [Aeromicrobium stalagmiti]